MGQLIMSMHKTIELFENWRHFVKEKKFSDYNPNKGDWVDIPLGDISNDPENIDITDELYALIEPSYAPIGGHIDFQKPADLPSNHTHWTAVDVDGDPEPDAVRVGKQKTGGLKMTAGASDGTTAGKKAYVAKTGELLDTPGNYGELSGAIAHVMITRANAPYVDNPEDVQKILGKKVEWIGEHPNGKYPQHPGWYARVLGGKKHMKIMMGKPNGFSWTKP